MATLLDWAQVHNRVLAVQKAFEYRSLQEAFSHFCLDNILPLTEEELRSSITDGGNDRGVDAVFIQRSAGRVSVHLFQIKFCSEFEYSKKNFPSKEIDKLQSFVSDLMEMNKDLEVSCNAILYEKVQEIWDMMGSVSVDFKIHLCSNMKTLQNKQYDRISSHFRRYRKFCVLQYGLSEFSQRLIEAERTRVDKKISLIGLEYFERSDGYLRGLVGSVRATDFIDLIRDDIYHNLVNAGLFEENIRNYLGSKNEVNQKIFKSAVSDTNGEFWYLNNGVTIVCDSFDYIPNSSSPLVNMVNLQVVNGGQTSYSLFEAARDDANRVRNVKVLVKIIETKQREIAGRIAEATNSQTPIRSRDLRSNDSVLVKMEYALKDMGYFFERKRNQYIDRPRSLRIDALKAGQCILAYYLEDPVLAKTKSNEIFGELYDRIFNEEITPSKILTAFKLYEAIDERREKAIQEMRLVRWGDYSEQWLVEGTFHALFVVGLLCERDGVDLENFDAAVVKIDEACNVIASYVENQKSASAYRIFRSAVTKRRLRQFAPARQLEFML